jgi:hypothetical protein
VQLYSGATLLALNKTPHLPRLLITIYAMIDSAKFGNKNHLNENDPTRILSTRAGA